MVWGGLCDNQLVGPHFFDLHRGRGGGVTAQRYIAEVLQPHVLPFFARIAATTFSKTMHQLTRHRRPKGTTSQCCHGLP